MAADDGDALRIAFSAIPDGLQFRGSVLEIRVQLCGMSSNHFFGNNGGRVGCSLNEAPVLLERHELGDTALHLAAR